MQIIYGFILVFGSLQQIWSSGEFSLDDWEKQRSYLPSSKGKKCTKSEALDVLAKAKYKLSRNQDELDRYFNTLWFSFAQNNIHKGLKHYASKLRTSFEDDAGTFTALVLIAKMTNQVLDQSFLTGTDRGCLLSSIDLYYEAWEQKFLKILPKVKSEPVKMLLTLASPFALNGPLPLLHNDRSTTVIADSVLNLKILETATRTDGYAFELKNNDDLSLPDNSKKFIPEKDWVAILNELRDDINVEALRIMPEQSFALDPALAQFWQNLTPDDFTNVQELTLPDSCSSLAQLKDAFKAKCFPKFTRPLCFKLFALASDSFLISKSEQPQLPEAGKQKEAEEKIREIIKLRTAY